MKIQIGKILVLFLEYIESENEKETTWKES